jgi:RNA 3'-terminal phosphate cyclase (ATP)
LRPFDVLERGARVEHYAECLLAGVPANVAQRELGALLPALGWGPEQVRATTLRQNEGPGNALMATVVHEHVSELVTAFGEKGVTAERVAGQAVRELRAYLASSGALGAHLADQWLLPLALAVVASGRPGAFSCTELSLHARSNIDVIEQFLPVQVLVSRLDTAVHVTVVPNQTGGPDCVFTPAPASSSAPGR